VLRDSTLDGLLEKAPMPSVAVSVFDRDRVLYCAVARAGREDWWDLASLTKVLVTLPEALARLELDAPLASLWPRAAVAPVGACTVRQMLSHSTGLPGTVQFFRTLAGRW
jgi:CubicO group peptidase (beta-lactamase class C family)